MKVNSTPRIAPKRKRSSAVCKTSTSNLPADIEQILEECRQLHASVQIYIRLAERLIEQSQAA